MKNNILTMKACRGLPASGKSTWSMEQVKLFPEIYKRVNRDSIRAMMDTVWTARNEKIVARLRDAAITEYFKAGYSVIVDDTNLSPKVLTHLEDLAKQHGATFEVVDFTHVSLQDCIDRDHRRTPNVGASVIKGMYYQFLHKTIVPPPYDSSLTDCMIVDLDGTLAIMDGKRSPYDASKCDITDDVNATVLDFINLGLSRNLHILFVSGRSEDNREPTMRFLVNKCNFSEVCPAYWDLHMRKSRDQRDDTVVKKEIYDEHIANKFNVVYIVDDRPKVVRMWQSLGYTVFNVGFGHEF